MKVEKDETSICIGGLDNITAELLQTAVLRLSEETHNPDHAAILRRLAILLDKTLK